MLKGNWDWDRTRQPKRKWKNKELGQRIKWSGPNTLEALGMPLLGVPPTQAEKEDHRRAWEVESWRCSQEQQRKLELLANELGIDTSNELWPYRLLLYLAAKEAPGFRIDWGGSPGPDPEWGELRCNSLIADVEIEKRRLKQKGLRPSVRAACRVLVATPKYEARYGKRARSEEAIKSRAASLHNNFLHCRKVSRLAVELIQGMPANQVDVLISIFSPEEGEAAAAEACVDASRAPPKREIEAPTLERRGTRRK